MNIMPVPKPPRRLPAFFLPLIAAILVAILVLEGCAGRLYRSVLLRGDIKYSDVEESRS